MSCQAYEDGSPFDTYLAITLAVGIILSYVPQQVSIIKRRTIEGISPLFLMLMNIGSALVLGNMLIESSPVLRCCPELSFYECANSLLGLIQVAAAFLGPLGILVLSWQFTGYDFSEYNELMTVGQSVAAVDFALLVVVVLSWHSSHSRMVSNALGLSGAVLGVIQYLPQLLTTYRLKHTGSLSKMTLLIQIPGGYLWCFSLYVREGSVWSTWITIFVAATLQSVLLILAMYYSFVNTQHVIAVISKPASPRLSLVSRGRYGSLSPTSRLSPPHRLPSPPV